MKANFVFSKKEDWDYIKEYKRYATIVTEVCLETELTKEAIKIKVYEKTTTSGEREIENPEYKKYEEDIRFSIAFIEEPAPDRKIEEKYTETKTKKLDSIIFRSGYYHYLDANDEKYLLATIRELCKENDVRDVISLLEDNFGIFNASVYEELKDQLQDKLFDLHSADKRRGYSHESAKKNALNEIKPYKQIIENNREKVNERVKRMQNDRNDLISEFNKL